MGKIKQEVKACRGNSDCLEKLNTKIQQDMVVLPKRIIESCDEVMIAMVKLELKTNICCRNANNDFHGRGTEIYNGILTCIRSKL